MFSAVNRAAVAEEVAEVIAKIVVNEARGHTAEDVTATTMETVVHSTGEAVVVVAVEAKITADRK